MANQHPYPQHIVEAVAKSLWGMSEGSVIWSWDELGPSKTRADQYDKAHAALKALWEASEVRTFGDLKDLPGTAIIANQQGQTSSLNDFLGIQEVGSPAHVIYWGNDDR